MSFIKKHLSMYSGLEKEIYILSYGRIVSSLGSLIWPVLNLIMRNKLGMSGTSIGLYTMILSLCMIPCNLIGGKIADKYNKKHILVTFDLMSNSLYLLCAFLPISMTTLILLSIGSVLQQMEGPSFDALLADLTTYQQREKAYSLMYFGMNLGFVLSPVLAGILFENYLYLNFLIAGICDLSSTFMIAFFIKRICLDNVVNENIYEQKEEGSFINVLKSRKILIYFFIIAAISGSLYSQYTFLLPLNLENIYGVKGAFNYGILSSINAFVVICITPFITGYTQTWMDSKRLYLGQVLEIIGLALFMIFMHQYGLLCIAMVIFTFGEVFKSIAQNPYVSKRIPSSHRGRFMGILGIINGLVGAISNFFVGLLIDHYSFNTVWMTIVSIGICLIVIMKIYFKKDKQVYKELYITK